VKSRTLIIVGAGIGGLSTGCYALMNGYRVRIFESHGTPGRLCTAWNRDGYVFDGCIHNLAGTSDGRGLCAINSDDANSREASHCATTQ
jgi:phytoene dehydrogenase-like protein